jgi:hypothetical protein
VDASRRQCRWPADDRIANQPAGSRIGLSYIIHCCSLLSSRTALSARRPPTLRATCPAHCTASPRPSSSATGLFVSLVPSSRRMPVARHTTCCLARRRLQCRVLIESVVFSSLVPSHSQLREALATTATPGFPSFCGYFPHRAHPTLGWEEFFGPEMRGSCRLYCMTTMGSFWSAMLRL